ncbi:hypothetical protein GGTG_10548 [Gaeumannomyces tritici R3-111a-1]|uniref:Signal peptide-containing protein n=1 Tax=Gaeumannomyces tritici (strain R3-111a-1) TaxID=644352 RepID=J3PAM3_GAET3|nr:hypothetical protein GGTG_10548 [Gaeumannomyces tritici R3-111a-1]EJT71289.1 hypothetical protein GGTG_10548 [Gaeumannomyces tritici R3-111a-1]
MQFLAALTILAAGVLAVATPDNLQKRANCNEVLPACAEGHIVGQQACPCPGQHNICDLWACANNRPMACGQDGTGCVWVG